MWRVFLPLDALPLISSLIWDRQAAIQCSPSVATTPSPTPEGSEQPSSAPSTTALRGLRLHLSRAAQALVPRQSRLNHPAGQSIAEASLGVEIASYLVFGRAGPSAARYLWQRPPLPRREDRSNPARRQVLPGFQGTASPSVSCSPSLRPTAVPSEPPSGPISCGNISSNKDCNSPCVWHKGQCTDAAATDNIFAKP